MKTRSTPASPSFKGQSTKHTTVKWHIVSLCLQIVLPVLYFIPGDQHHHSYENSLDALLMIKNDGKLIALSGSDSIQIAPI